MKAWKRTLAVGGALAIVGASVVLGVGSAQAATVHVTATPHVGIKNGTKVAIIGSGFTPGAQIAMGECPAGVEAKGPGYCASQLTGGSFLGVATATGAVSHTLTMTVGPLHNTIGKPATCDVDNDCYIEVENISNHAQFAKIKLTFAGSSTKTTVTKSTNSSSSGTKSTTTVSKTTTTASDPSTATLPHTGASGTLITALIGFVLLQVGLVAAVRATRSAPRRIRL